MKLISKFKGMMNSDSKSKQLIMNIVFSLGVKGLAIIIALINMPVFMNYFPNNTILGLWFTLLSMLNWILTFDLGIGNGLRNYLVVSFENKDKQESKKLISSAYFSIGIFAIVLSIITFIVVPHINWNVLCNVPEKIIERNVLSSTIRILLLGIWIQLFLKIIQSILYSMQKSAIPNMLVLISNILLLLCTFILKTNNQSSNLIRLAMAYVFTANIPMLITTLILFRTKLKGLGFNIKFISMKHSKKILSLGLSFLMLQLLTMLVFNTREFYIMRFVDPDSVVQYQIYNKLFSLVSTFFILTMTPLWSAITQAIAQKDYKWIKGVYKKGIILFILFSIGSILVVALSQILVNIWLGEKTIGVNYAICALFVIYNIEYMWISLHSQFENGLGYLKVQKIGFILATILLPIIVILMTNTWKYWWIIVVANIITLLPLCIMQPINLNKIIISRSK